MPDIYTAATQLAVLQAGRTPVWTAQDGIAIPDSAADGVYLDGAVRTLAYVSLREVAHARRARLTIPTVDLSATYTTTINGTAVAYNAGSGGADADRAAVIDGIIAAINADGTVGPLVTATAEGTPHDTVLITGDSEADYSIAFAGGGSSVVACVADLCSAECWPWFAPGARVDSTPPTAWVVGGEAVVVDRRGYLERLDTAGLDRLHLQLAHTAGQLGDGSATTYRDPDVYVGPCLSEVEVS